MRLEEKILVALIGFLFIFISIGGILTFKSLDNDLKKYEICMEIMKDKKECNKLKPWGS